PSIASQLVEEQLAASRQGDCPDAGNEQREEEEPAEIKSGPQLRRERDEEEVDALLARHPSRTDPAKEPMEGKNGEELWEQLLVTQLHDPWTGEREEKGAHGRGPDSKTDAPSQEHGHRAEIRCHHDDHPELERRLRSEVNGAEQPVDRRHAEEDLRIGRRVPGREEDRLIPETDRVQRQPAGHPAVP